MSNSTTYSSGGSKTTRPIKDAPYSVRSVWKYANSMGIAIIRVRTNEVRYEQTFGKTFRGTHFGRVSVYVPIKNPKKNFLFKKINKKISWVKRLLSFNKSSMQIFEVPKERFDLDEVYSTIKKTEKILQYSNSRNPFLNNKRS